MIDTDVPAQTEPTEDRTAPEPRARGVVVQGHKATSYVGGTHFMAILEDVCFSHHL